MAGLHSLLLLFVVIVLTGCRAADESKQSNIGSPPVHTSTVIGASQDPKPGCAPWPSNAAVTKNLIVDGVERTYRLYVPESSREGTPVPLVLNFHGYGGSAISQEQYSGLVDDANKAGFILASPQAIGSPPHWHIWPAIELENIDDIAFVEALLEEVSSNYCIDQGRIYAVGISNGAAMVSLLACSLEGQLAAIAFVAGVAYLDSCEGLSPVPVVAFHGTADLLVPFDGGPLSIRPPVPKVIERWALNNLCLAVPSTSKVSPDVTLQTFDKCVRDLEFYIIEDGGHTWPGTEVPKPLYGRTTPTINASEIIWEFFSRQ